MEFSGKSFNGDHFIAREIESLCEGWVVETIVETGTYHGVTTAGLAKFAKATHTIENNQTYYLQSEHLDQWPLVQRHLGSSPEVLEWLLRTLARPILFYLDAHWEAYWPLKDELAAISCHKLADSILVIHDFFVPGSDLGYDVHGGQRLDLEFIRPSLNDIYGEDGYRYRYNSSAAGARRGVIYVSPSGGGG